MQIKYAYSHEPAYCEHQVISKQLITNDTLRHKEKYIWWLFGLEPS